MESDKPHDNTSSDIRIRKRKYHEIVADKPIKPEDK